jgi:hypothetical protein
VKRFKVTDAGESSWKAQPTASLRHLGHPEHSPPIWVPESECYGGQLILIFTAKTIDLASHFIKEDIWIANMHMKERSVSLVVRKIQIDTTIT